MVHSQNVNENAYLLYASRAELISFSSHDLKSVETLALPLRLPEGALPIDLIVA